MRGGATGRVGHSPALVPAALHKASSCAHPPPQAGDQGELETGAWAPWRREGVGEKEEEEEGRPHQASPLWAHIFREDRVGIEVC